MKIKLKSLTLNFFKGVKNLTVNFDETETNIYGDNEVGKTTLYDAWYWLFFGVNSFEKKDFSIKTLDENNIPIPNLEHIVESVVEIDNLPKTFKKIFREKYTKKRGSEQSKFTGHETDYLINDCPVSQTEYNAAITKIIPEQLFKIFTNPLYFNSLKWDSKRAIIMKLTANFGMSDEEFIKSSADFIELAQLINLGKTLEEIKRETGSKKLLLNNELKTIPTRIDEITRNIAVRTNDALLDEKTTEEILTNEIKITETNLIFIEGKIKDEVTFYNEQHKEFNENKTAINLHKGKIQHLKNAQNFQSEKAERERDNNIQLLNQTITSKQSSINNNLSVITSKESQIKQLELSRQELLKEWYETNEKELTFDDGFFKCPTCSKPFDASDIETKKKEFIVNFNKNKLQSLEIIEKQGATKNTQKQNIQKEIDDLKLANENHSREITKAQSEINKINSTPLQVEANTTNEVEIKKLTDELLVMESKVTELPKFEENAELVDDKAKLKKAIEWLQKQLNIIGVNAKEKIRIDELQAQQRKLSTEIAQLEKREFLLLKFIKAKIDYMEEHINSFFKFTKFKMYKELINGGTEEICETLYKGVPYGDVNTAGRIWVGIDIINGISKYYNYNCPIFIDNRESTSNIPETEAQIINLIKNKADKVLRVE